MQKRKAKLNILDIAIILTVICAVAVLGFHHYIVEFFAEPQIAKATAAVTVSHVNADMGIDLKEGDAVQFYPDSDSDEKIGAKIKKITFGKNNTATVELEFNGYIKFGRTYLEKGELIRQGDKYDIAKGKEITDCVVKTVKFN